MIDYFAKVVGKENVTEELIDKEAYSTDASQIKGETALVVWPTKPEQVHVITLFAKRNKLNLISRGAGTNLTGAVVPKKSIILDFSKMNNIIEINEDEKYAVVEPGVILSNLNNKLKNTFFPVIPSSHKVCSIGGMIGTNAAGVRAIKYGKMEDWVLELECVDGTGRYWTLNENDSKKICGTEGTAMIITKAILKLADKIKEHSVDVFKFDDLREVIERVVEARDDNSVIAMEFIDKTAANIAKLEDKYYLLIEYENLKGSIANENEVEKIWKMRDSVYTILASNDYSIIQDPKVNIESLETLLEWLEKNKIPVFGHIGIGILHPMFRQNEIGKIKEMFEIVKDLKGEVSGEHGIGLLKRSYATLAILSKIKMFKQKYDPDNILNKGKII